MTSFGEGHLADIQAVIQSARARGGTQALERYLTKRLPESDAAEVKEAAEVAEEIVDSIPIFLARARQEADHRGLSSVVGPLLDHAERYYIQPMDLIPEMTQGLPGLLDDSYLIIRILQNLERGPQPFLDWDLEYPLAFLRRIMGEEVSRKLDDYAIDAMQEVSEALTKTWTALDA